MKRFTKEQVSSHKSEQDCWIIINNKVYDVTKFLSKHPGGKSVITSLGGKDVTKVFNSIHSTSVLLQYGKELQIGEISTGDDLKKKDEKLSNKWYYGDQIPFCDPYWYQGFKSPYYKDTHFEFRDKVRKFVETELKPHINKWEEQEDFPREIITKAQEAGLWAITWPKEYGGTPPRDYDNFHALILTDELMRCGNTGFLGSTWLAQSISFTPVLKSGNKYLLDKFGKDVVSGKVLMALAITEPWAGSDVAAIQTTAKKEGDYYIVNGEKKFITGGMKADYLTVAVRTGGPGMYGISMIVIDTHSPGVERKRMKTQGGRVSSTTYFTFTNVKVPVKHLLGRENQGFKLIVENFNAERYGIIIGCNRASRMCIEESIKYGRIRKTFGKRLIDHQVIRHKIAEMVRRVESTHALIEQITYQVNQGIPDIKLGGNVALLKVIATSTFEYCAREASQILGGNSYIVGSSFGGIVERLYRDVRMQSIAGGSEEIMQDLAMKMAKL